MGGLSIGATLLQLLTKLCSARSNYKCIQIQKVCGLGLLDAVPAGKFVGRIGGRSPTICGLFAARRSDSF